MVTTKKWLFALFTVSVFFSCKKNEENKAKVVYDTKKESKTTEKESFSEIEVVDLPIQFKSSNYLLYPVGKVILNNKYSAKSAASYAATTRGGSFTISNFMDPEITGNFQNILFQAVDSANFKPLTEEKVLITNINYLDEIAFRTDRKYLLYIVYDMDTNHDQLMDTNDVKALYLSKDNGEDFRKLSNDFEEVLDWKIIPESGVLLYRTLTDTNKNGLFEKGDRINFYRIDFKKAAVEVEAFNPSPNQ